MKKERMKKSKFSGASNSQAMEEVKAEIAIMKKLNHPHVLRLFEVMDDPNVNILYLVLEYMKKGDLKHMLQGDNNSTSCQTLSDTDVWIIARHVTRGLHYLHSQNIIHGDIKP